MTDNSCPSPMTIKLNEFYVDKTRGHPTVITLKITDEKIFYKIQRGGYLEPKVYSCNPENFKSFYVCSYGLAAF